MIISSNQTYSVSWPGAFRLKPSMNPNHPPYPTTINGGVHDSDHFLGEAQEAECARVAFAEDAETPITSNTPYRTPSLPHSRSTRTGTCLSVFAPDTV